MQLFLTEALEEIVIATIVEGVNKLGQLWVVVQHLKNVRTINDLIEGEGESVLHTKTDQPHSRIICTLTKD